MDTHRNDTRGVFFRTQTLPLLTKEDGIWVNRPRRWR